MKYKLKNIPGLILLFSALSVSSFGKITPPLAENSASVELEKMISSYQNHKSLSMQVTYKLYPSYTSEVMTESQTGVIKKYGRSQFSNFLGTETLLTPDNLIIVDREEKMILVCDPVVAKKTTPSVFEIDTLLAHFSSVLVSENQDQKIFKLRDDKSKNIDYDEMDIVVDKSTYLIHKIIFFYKNPVNIDPNATTLLAKPRLEVIFSDVIEKLDVEASVFSEKTYFEKSKGKLTASSRFKGYRVLNQKLN